MSALLARRSRVWLWGLVAALGALAPAIWLWGFTVDDALISIRYARHVATGVGYRFNAAGPSTDGVTPLPWPWLLAPMAHAEPLVVLWRAKMLGLLVWTATAAAWGIAIGMLRGKAWVKGAAIVALAACVPVAVHAVSGMETAVVIVLCTWATIAASRPPVAAVIAGVAAAFRPEMLPWAVALSVGLEAGRLRGGSPGRMLRGAIVSAVPFGACVLVRLFAFGRMAPLSVAAKPGDLAHGIIYVAAASLAALAPILAMAPIAVARSEAWVRAVAVAAVVHLCAVVAVGGDWMPYARLIAPIVPSLLLVFVASAAHASFVATAVRVTLALGLSLYLLVTAAPAARRVSRDREDLVALAKPYLGGAKLVAALDVGWPSADSEGSLLDLGGLTDPEVAMLPGGQTSKRFDDVWLVGKHPDVILAYAPRFDVPLAEWREAPFSRGVENRLAASDLVGARFTARAFLPLGTTGAGYVVLLPRDAN